MYMPLTMAHTPDLVVELVRATITGRRIAGLQDSEAHGDAYA
jgi:hypothetical protein